MKNCIIYINIYLYFVQGDGNVDRKIIYLYIFRLKQTFFVIQ